VSDFAKELLNYGVLGVIVAFCGASMVTVALWLKPRIEQFLASHLSLIESLQKTQMDHTLILHQLKQAIEDLHDVIRGEKQ
jgi:hypothetical protein